MARSVRLALSALFATALLALQLPRPMAVAAADGLTMSAASTYTVNAAAGRLDVTIQLQLTNTTPNSGGLLYYYNAAAVYLESGATNVRASADSGSASPVLSQRGTTYDTWRINFGAAIYFGASRTLTVTYQVASGAPRSASTIRVGAASADFCVISNGLDTGTVRVVAPSAFTFTFVAVKGAFTNSTGSGSTTWTSGTITDTFNFWACFAGANEAGYTATSVKSPSGREIRIESWPEDQVWRDTVTNQVASALGPLEALIGRGLPGSGPITIQEVTAYSLGFYAGTFDTDKGIARVSEEMDPGTVAHELSHAWFNGNLFTQRWLSEGSAGWAESTVTKVACKDPGQPPGGVTANINTWAFAGPRATATELAAIDYEYTASCYVVSEIAAKAGPEGTRAALAALMDGLSPYRSRAAQPRLTAKVGWREWLDAMDELGIYPSRSAGLDFAQDLARRFGAGPAGDVALLAQRSEVRKAYHDVADVADWALPEPVLRAMTDWRFTDARALIADAAAAWGNVSAATRALPEADVLGGSIKGLFEGARSPEEFTAAVQAAADARAAADLVAAAKARLAAPRENVVKLGLAGKDLSASLAAAVAAVTAGDLATARARTDEIDRTLDDEGAAAATVVAAKDRADGGHDILTTIGLVGADLGGKVSTAVAAVAAVDAAAAVSAAGVIDQTLADAPGQGLLRVVILLALAVVAGAVIGIRRRKGTALAMATSTAVASPEPAASPAPGHLDPAPPDAAAAPSRRDRG